MIRRIALTLGMGVAVLTLGARIAPSSTATDAAASLTPASRTLLVATHTPRGPHRSGYIVASS
jgi:hypothetical protein